jgi:hypothetical protein
MTTPFDFLRSRTIWYFALIFAIYLFTGCDNFWVACTEAGVVCTTLADAGSTEDGTVVIPPDPNKPIGPTRKFEEKAFIKVDPNKLKYVGMKGTTPVFLANEDKSVSPNLPRWVAYQLDLLKATEEERITLDMNRIGFPAAPRPRLCQHAHPCLRRAVLHARFWNEADQLCGAALGTLRRREVARQPTVCVLPASPDHWIRRDSAKPTLMNARSARWFIGRDLATACSSTTMSP